MSYMAILGEVDTTVPPLSNTQWSDVTYDTSSKPGGWYYHTSRSVSDTIADGYGCGARVATTEWGIADNPSILNCTKRAPCSGGADVVECLAIGKGHDCYSDYQLPLYSFMAAHPKPRM